MRDLQSPVNDWAFAFLKAENDCIFDPGARSPGQIMQSKEATHNARYV